MHLFLKNKSTAGCLKREIKQEEAGCFTLMAKKERYNFFSSNSSQGKTIEHILIYFSYQQLDYQGRFSLFKNYTLAGLIKKSF